MTNPTPNILDFLKKYDRSIVLIFTALTVGYTMYFTVKGLKEAQASQTTKIEIHEKAITDFKEFMAAQRETNKRLDSIATDVHEMLTRQYHRDNR
jgi:uncharacterized protein HemX